MAKNQISHTKLATTLSETVLLLVAVSPLLVLFGLVRNVGLLAILVTLTGILAWWSVILRYPKSGLSWRSPLLIAGLVYVGFCVVSILANLGIASAFGTPLIRLGAIQLIGCLGIGLALQPLANKKVVTYIYGSLVALSLITLPYALLHPLPSNRVGGTFYQPDFLAVTLAVGFLLGLTAWQYYPKYRWIIIVAQVYVLSIIYLTQTRAVIALLPVTVIILVLVSKHSWQQKMIVSGLSVLVLAMLFIVTPISHNRLNSSDYAISSTTYRIALQKTGLQHLTDRPIAGYGIGNLMIPLACPNLHDVELIRTCQTGHYFNSSHNIYIDRFLALGWLGGGSFVVLSSILLWRTWKQRETRIFAAAALLILLYYLTNLTAITIELLLWICLFRKCDNLHIIIDDTHQKRL